MCQIYCGNCKKLIFDDENVYEIRQGFVENGEFTPEIEVNYFHTDCLPINSQPTEDQ